MNCDETQDVLAAYAIGALGAGEHRATREHLRDCRRHDESLAGLLAVVDVLPFASEERDPSPEVRERLLRDFEESNTPTPVATGSEREQRRRSFNPTWALATAAVLIAGLLMWNVALLRDGSGESGALIREWSSDRGEARLVYLPGEGLAVIDLDFDGPPAGRVYQAWEMHGDVPENLGVVPRGGTAAFSGLADADALAVSIEPPGGSQQPTSEPILVMPLLNSE